MNISRIDHVGLRVLDFVRSKNFYQLFGFQVIREDSQEGVVVVRHPTGVEINLLDNANSEQLKTNILMDNEQKYPGFTHLALAVESITPIVDFLNEKDIKITEGPVTFGDGKTSIFVRDPDFNVLEFTSQEKM